MYYFSEERVVTGANKGIGREVARRLITLISWSSQDFVDTFLNAASYAFCVFQRPWPFNLWASDGWIRWCDKNSIIGL